ncbi:MAG: oligosaccharide flippase family protein [Sedimentisphaerales bacterium]|jgi:O-antigen/teichoic acid export membrane protein|nr:oligosaccharide flippase family protein [Sedimentisphaerales bacterium]HNY76785.1 oligosaccharide flippase family protein [Sedimentisphaerales bacterium]HOC61608.1 oligosaccharide flippase family protein [Sedimentisphaerales bacterium]HOH62440.1 oligosaccharide flippase family protein [Sedimentisphaerales bacterium]HQA88628.1 oligosaccharide flippase family protein [Sedimentisphaerales bacterium]
MTILETSPGPRLDADRAANEREGFSTVASPTFGPRHDRNKTQQSVLFGLGGVLAACISIAKVAAMSHCLAPTVYGTFRQVLYVYATTAVILELGLPKAVGYFLPQCSPGEGRRVLGRILSLLFLSGGCLSLSLYLLANPISQLLNNAALAPVLRAYAPVPILLIPTLPLRGVCATFGLARRCVIVEMGTQIIVLLALVLPSLMGYGLIVSMRVWSLASLLNLGIVFQTLYAPFRGYSPAAGKFSARVILAYSMPLVLSSILSAQMVAADRFVVSRWYGPEQFAVYSNGAWLLPMIPIITSSTMSVLLPSFTHIINAGGSTGEVLKLWRRAMDKTVLIVYPCIAFAFFHAEAIISVLFSDKYLASVSIFRVYLLVGVFRVIAFSPMMMAMGYVRSYTIAHIIACAFVWVAAVVLAMAHVPLACIAGVFVASVAIVVVLCVGRIASGLEARLAEVVPLRRILAVAVWSMLLAGLSKAVVLLVPIVRDGAPIVGLLLGATSFSLAFLVIAERLNMGVIELVRSLGSPSRP